MTPNLQIFTELPTPPQVAGVGPFIYRSEHYGLSFWTLRMPYYFYSVSHFFALCMCVMYLTSILLMTDGLNAI